jgi:hypothetical protein
MFWHMQADASGLQSPSVWNREPTQAWNANAVPTPMAWVNKTWAIGQASADSAEVCLDPHLWYITPAAFRMRPAASMARSLSIFMFNRLNGTCFNYGPREPPQQHRGGLVRCAGFVAPAACYTPCLQSLRKAPGLSECSPSTFRHHRRRARSYEPCAHGRASACRSALDQD